MFNSTMSHVAYKIYVLMFTLFVYADMCMEEVMGGNLGSRCRGNTDCDNTDPLAHCGLQAFLCCLNHVCRCCPTPPSVLGPSN